MVKEETEDETLSRDKSVRSNVVVSARLVGVEEGWEKGGGERGRENRRRRRKRRRREIASVFFLGLPRDNVGWTIGWEGRKEGRKGAVVAPGPVAPPIGAPPRGGEYI